MSCTGVTLDSDPLTAVRSRLTRAEDLLNVGRWAEAEATLREAIATLGRARDTPPPLARGCLTPNQARRVRQYVEANLERQITLADLAAVAGLSPSHFCRVFRETFGRPPLSYVQHRRVKRAKGLMLTTDATLAAIALECGLYDQAALSKLFRRVTGQSPAAWRRLRRA
jgi:AraC-like DNA-binding protein